MTIRCSDIEEALSAYADGQELPEETHMVRAHLETCESCRALLAQWQRITVPMSEPIGSVPERVAARIQMASPRRFWAGKALAAAALLTMAATGTVLAGLTRPAGDELGASDGNAKGSAVAQSHRPTSRPGAASASPSARPTRPPSNRPTSARGTDGRLLLVLKLDKGWANEGDDVAADFTLRNVTDQPVTFLSPAESAFDLVIRHGRAVTYRRSATWSGEMVSRTIEPGAELTEHFVFQSPAPGRYVIHGNCRCGHQHRQTVEPTPAPTDSAEPTARPARPTTRRPTDRPARPRSGPVSTGEIRFISYPSE